MHNVEVRHFRIKTGKGEIVFLYGRRLEMSQFFIL